MAGTAKDRLQTLLDREAAKRPIRGILASIRSIDGSLETVAAAGFADAATTVPLTPETPYYLASITKTYTAAVVMQLSREGSLDLDAPIGKYLATELTKGIHVVADTDHGLTITVEQLLFQTSGLADYFAGRSGDGPNLEEELNAANDRALTIENIVALVRTQSPRFVPGAGDGRKAHYSDTNYALLGSIIETVTGADVSENLEERIFDPLGLTDTFVFDSARSQPTPAVAWHKDRPLDIPLAMSSFPADGGVVATLADNVRFIAALFTGELLAEDELAYMTGRWNRIFFPMQYGGGLMRFYLPKWMSPFRNPGELIGHSGSTGSFAFYSPQYQLVLAGTVNQSDNPARPYRLMPRLVSLARTASTRRQRGGL